MRYVYGLCIKRLTFVAGVIPVLCGLSWPVYANDSLTCSTGESEASVTDTANTALPDRDGPRIRTTGRVPHVQVDVTPVAEVNKEIYRFAFSLPGVEERPTIVSLPGATGMWLSDEVPVAHPKAIVAGREFSHIHPDGSFHAPLPYKRALELSEKGWGELHPWSQRQDGWEGFVMIYSARSTEEMKVVLQLVTESYNHVTGQNIQLSC